MKNLIVQQHLRAKKGGMIKTINGLHPAVLPSQSSLSTSFKSLGLYGAGTPAHKKLYDGGAIGVRKPLKFRY